MITLDATLKAAQDGKIHSPIIELISSSYLADIPFDGQTFNDLADAESKPNVIFASSGRIVATVLRSGGVYLLATDTGRTQWTETHVLTVPYYNVISACPVELDDGNIGIVYLLLRWIYPGDYVCGTITISQDGATVGTPATIFTKTSLFWMGDVHVSRQPDDEYRMVYSYRDDAAAYAIMLSASEDFVSWSTPQEIAISGLGDTLRYGNPSLQWASESAELFLCFDHVDSLREDGTELINIYYQTSGDYGGTWSSPVNLSEYTQYGVIGYHPSIAERVDGKLEIAWTEKSNVLHIDENTEGYQSSGYPNCGPMYAADIHYDPASNKLFVTQYDMCSITVVDVDTWTIEKCFTIDTVPAYNSIFMLYGTGYHRNFATGQYVGAATVGNNSDTAMVIDTVADTIKTYQFTANVDDYGLVKNVDTPGVTGHIWATYLDSDAKKFYVMFVDDGFSHPHIYIGFIDITQTADPITGKYSWSQIISSTVVGSWGLAGFNQFMIVPEINCAMLSFGAGILGTHGRLLVISLSSGGVIKDYEYSLNPGFHYNGIGLPCYYDGKIYGGFAYSSEIAMADRRGMMIIDMASDTISYNAPTYATRDDYGLGVIKPTGDGRLIIGTAADGVVVFDTQDQTWTRFNNDSMPGLTPDGSNDLIAVDYDPATGTVFAGAYDKWSGWTGVLSFAISGAFYQGKYVTGEYGTGWTWSDPKQLTLNHFDKENAIAIDDENGMWSLWVKVDGAEESVLWDHESGASDLTEYIVSGQPVSIQWSVESPNKLTFTLSHGHLFDPQNQMSVLSQALQMGRLITARIGETVSGVDYWQNQGIFVVRDTKLSYARGDYPTISVSAEDYTSIWEEGTITATESYDDVSPAHVLTDLVEQFGVLGATQIAISELVNTHNIYHQFIDKSLSECVKVILDHFGYFSFVNTDGQFEPRHMDSSAAVSHTYTTTDSIINYTPDNSFSTFTNRVVVTGEGRYFIEVLYDEESVGAMNGTIGWWGEKTQKKIYYSEDRARICRNPRLEIIQSLDDFWLFKKAGGGSEFISAVDYYETWVEITVEGPNLTGVVVGEIVVILGLGIAALVFDITVFALGVIMFAMSISLSILFYTLACIATYSYNIFARPLGKEKQTIQAQADDIPFQQKMNGQIVEEKIDDPLCYEIAHCQRVADFEMAVVMAQRNRVKFEKIGHLQDEIGDIISVIHPYSGVTKKVFIAELSRSYMKPDATVSNSGGLIDSIDGWVIP